MAKMKKLWLDDIRDPAEWIGPDWKEKGWVWAKDYDEAIAYLSHGHIIAASLDNDLGPWPMKEGRHVLLWMIENKIRPELGVMTHSANPVASQRMRQDIERYEMTPEERLW